MCRVLIRALRDQLEASSLVLSTVDIVYFFVCCYPLGYDKWCIIDAYLQLNILCCEFAEDIILQLGGK